MSRYKVHLTALPPTTYTQLPALLHPYLPHSLTILGALSQQSPQKILIWTSFQSFPTSTGELPFAIFLCTPSNSQCRFFTSLECAPTASTQQDEAFVTAAVQEGLALAKAELLREHSESSLARGLMVGSVHEKWVPCLSPLSRYANSCVKFLCNTGTTAASETGLTLPEGTILAKLEEADLAQVVAASHIPRTHEYLRSRLADSAGVRIPSSLSGEENGVTQLAAWAFIHVDGSIGTLHVEPAFRRMGLARVVVRALVDRLSEQEAEELQEDVGANLRRARKGWAWVDTEANNEQGLAFFGKLEGWERGEGAWWMGFDV
jgi:ribosomal protein S18 acetylase RimI-like enzyme